MHLQRRLALLGLSSARPAAPEPLELRGDFSGSISQLGHFSCAAAAFPRSVAVRGGTETWRPATVPTTGFPNSDSRGEETSPPLDTFAPTLRSQRYRGAQRSAPQPGPAARSGGRSVSRRMLHGFIGAVTCSATAGSKEEVTKGHLPVARASRAWRTVRRPCMK